MEKFTDELGDKIKAWFDSVEVRDAIAATEKSVDDEVGTFEVIITTENLDRYQEVISLDGWELDHYRNNPVVLWGHDHFTLPIGVATSVDIIDGKMVAKGKFAPHQHAQDIRRLYDMGIVRATSVGFIEKERQGNLITKAELLEFSFVSVPANPYALSLAMKHGESIDALVTRGIFSVKDAEPAEPDEAAEPEEPEAPVVEEKTFSSKSISPIVTQLKAVINALEALNTEELERIEPEPEAAVESEDERSMREFAEKRRIVQEAATLLGDVLAEARLAIKR